MIPNGLLWSVCPQVAPRTELGGAVFHFNQQHAGFKAFTVRSMSSWADPAECSCYYWDWLDPVRNMKYNDVAILNVSQACEHAALLRHIPQCVQLTTVLHEIGHGVVQALLPWQCGQNPRQAFGEFPDEDLTWQIAWEIRNALPVEFQQIAAPAVWNATRHFYLGAYFQATLSAGKKVSLLPDELRRVIMGEGKKLWAGGISVR